MADQTIVGLGMVRSVYNQVRITQFLKSPYESVRPLKRGQEWLLCKRWRLQIASPAGKAAFCPNMPFATRVKCAEHRRTEGILREMPTCRWMKHGAFTCMSFLKSARRAVHLTGNQSLEGCRVSCLPSRQRLACVDWKDGRCRCIGEQERRLMFGG